MDAQAQPFFSIIVPMFRAAATLRRAAESIRTQSEGDWEAVLVDDGSPDDSATLARSLAAEDSRFRCTGFPQNRGTHAARKAGVAEARGQWILFLDPDDELAPGILEQLRHRVERDPADLIRFDFAFRNPSSGDDELRRFHEERRCSGRSDRGPGCALPHFFNGANASMQLWSFLSRAEVCKDAFARTEDSRLIYAEDIYEVFALAACAASYGEEPFAGYLYSTDSGGITKWRASRDSDPAAYAEGYFASLGARVDSFAAMARFARAFQGPFPARRAVFRAILQERRRFLLGTLPWDFSVLAAAGVSRREALRRARPAFSALTTSDRVLLRTALAARTVLERLRLLPSAARMRRRGSREG